MPLARVAVLAAMSAALLCAAAPASALSTDGSASPWERAVALVAKMNLTEKIAMCHGESGPCELCAAPVM